MARILSRLTWSGAMLAALVVVAGVNLADLTKRVPPPPRVKSAGTPDLIARQEARLDALRRELERRKLRGTVGYVTDAIPETDDRYSAQFALLPVVLDSNVAAQDWVVGNFRGPNPRSAIPGGFVVEKEFPDGVFLLRKAAP